ncbi:MAG: winged helix-turn-helix transcriptional regulator [Acidimicrobiales bacterium]|jgi:DNA-binding HxlR family transcriptional regulator
MRSYGQYCALAKALDVVGDRWTLLIVRELLVRPSRYSELQDGLTGIATNLLAERLRQLEGAGVVGRDAENRYELTDRGRQLGTAVHELVRWGAPLMLVGQDTDTFRARWLELPLELMFGGIDRGRPNLQIEVRTGDEVLTLSSNAGSVDVRTGPAPSPDVVVTGRPELIVGLMSGALDKDVAMSQGVSILGDFANVERLRRDDWLDPPTEIRPSRRQDDFTHS